MTDTATIERCPNCALLLLRPKDTVEPRTARVEELLHQNHPPLDIEVSAFRKIAEDAQVILEDLDIKIVRARELLDNLLSERLQAQSRLDDAKSILHPMRSIPSELLTQIFHDCIPTAYQPEDPDVLDPRGAPWLFSGVCRRWRELAVNTPQLWTHLFLDFDKHLGRITERQCVYKVGVFTQRSRGLPMDVYLGSLNSIADHLVLAVLEVSLPQWRYLHVDLPSSSLQSLSGNSFLSLQRLKLIVDDESDPPVDVFQPMRTPVLRALEAASGEPWHAFQYVSVPWCNLTSVANFPAFDVEAMSYLRTMAELKKLDVLASPGTRTPIQNVVALSKLRCLTITEDEDAVDCSKEFFCALAIPALSELTLNYHDTSLLHFPMSPLPLGNLIKLEITCEMNAHEENTRWLLDFLTLTHHVESLHISDTAIDLAFVDGLNLDTSPLRLPCLQSLDINDCGFAFSLCTPSNLDAFYEMLLSRLPAVEGRHGGEGATAFCDAGMIADAAMTETRTEASRLDSNCPPRCLKAIQVPYDLYVQTRTEWQETFLELASRAKLECGEDD